MCGVCAGMEGCWLCSFCHAWQVQLTIQCWVDSVASAPLQTQKARVAHPRCCCCHDNSSDDPSCPCPGMQAVLWVHTHS